MLKVGLVKPLEECIKDLDMGARTCIEAMAALANLADSDPLYLFNMDVGQAMQDCLERHLSNAKVTSI